MMDASELLACLVFAGYFALILLSFFFVFKSILHGVQAKELLDSRPFLFLRIAVVALGCTWYFMIEFMRWSYQSYAHGKVHASFAAWLKDTPLFEQAWTIVCTGKVNWWLSSWICTWAVLFSAMVFLESPRRGIRHRWAYILLGQLVAISVSTCLFLTAMSLHPRVRRSRDTAKFAYLTLLWFAMFMINPLANHVGTPQFLRSLLGLHALLFMPLLIPLRDTPAVGPSGDAKSEGSFDGVSSFLYVGLVVIALSRHLPLTVDLLRRAGPHSLPKVLLYNMFYHPAQTSVSFDVVWFEISMLAWWLTSGSLLSIVGKLASLLSLAAGVIVSFTGINWSLTFSIVPIVLLAIVGLCMLGLSRIRSRNQTRRRALLQGLGLEEGAVVPGTDKEPPSMSGKKVIVGFWHPYCNAGGGGERVLWTAIAYLQRTHPGIVCLVYSGDYPQASKQSILGRVKERFSISLDPGTLEFIPLPDRHVVDDEHWKHFTLLGQSLGSVYLAWQGLCGEHGLWGDVFLDSMGYAFTWPLVRLVAGEDIAVGAYVHYPTVSSDMVKRVRERKVGVESGGKQGGWLKTRVKLLYYHVLTALYSTSLLFAKHIMTNSSWTQDHITSLIKYGRDGLLAALLTMDEVAMAREMKPKLKCEVVYPPCDTEALVGSKLQGRKREMISLAQFRPEKEHSKQLYSLAKLFESHPEYRDGKGRVVLTLAGGARHPKDEARVDGLRALARELGIEDNVTFLVNAPYPEIVSRLGQASIGLNTMQDEHFGINIVEFMAAGLIPIVHASAGPFMDIVVPFNGQQTGFHATSPEEFAARMHEALSLSEEEQMTIRKAARESAQTRFSEKVFGEAFEDGYAKLIHRRKRRR